MIDLGTIAGLHAHDRELHCYCRQCDRWVVLDLAGIIRNGHGERWLPLTVRCRVCGEPGQLRARPPMPGWTNASRSRTDGSRQSWTWQTSIKLSMEFTVHVVRFTAERRTRVYSEG